MPTGFTQEQQEAIREQLFTAGIQLIAQYGLQRTTINKLTQKCGIAKGSFYLFYASKEDYILALSEYTAKKTGQMLQQRLAGRTQMPAREFFAFYKEYLYSDYDLMGKMDLNDFLWLKEHLANQQVFDPQKQSAAFAQWMSLISDARPDFDLGVVINLLKCIYAMREHRDTLVEASLDASIDMILKTVEIYVSGSGQLLSES